MSLQGFLLPYSRFRATDANGLPIAGALLYTYESGGTTPKATFTDAGLTSANPNPTVCNASGECVLFVAAGDLYRLALHDAADVQLWVLDGIEATTAAPAAPAAPAPVPTGGIVAYGGTSAPTGYLLCDGSAVSRSTYAALFTAIASAFGSGDGSSTFNVPNLQGFFPFGKSASGTGSTLGGTFGAVDHVHTGPSHTHGVTVPRDGWGDTLALPSISGRLNVGDSAGTGQFNSSYQPTADKAVTSDAAGTGNTGTANPPGLSVNFLIKT